MADVTVFVDDAVLGRLPGVCARDGVPTTDRMRISEEVGRDNRLGILWLLFLVGPMGWIVLIFVVPRSSGEHLVVELPYSEAAHNRIVEGRRLRNTGLFMGFAVTIGLLFLTAWARLGSLGAMLIVATVAVAAGVALRGMWRIAMASVNVELDASRRWVTLRGVHPAFAAACRDQRSRQYQS